MIFFAIFVCGKRKRKENNLPITSGGETISNCKGQLSQVSLHLLPEVFPQKMLTNGKMKVRHNKKN